MVWNNIETTFNICITFEDIMCLPKKRILIYLFDSVSECSLLRDDKFPSQLWDWTATHYSRMNAAELYSDSIFVINKKQRWEGA